jgi:membrane-bound lytic murein transglycosylase D
MTIRLNILCCSLWVLLCLPLEVSANQDSAEAQQLDALKALANPKRYDIPIRWNEPVQNLVKYYAKRKDHVLKLGIQRSGLYMDLMRQELRAWGLPQDLVFVAAVESNFNARSVSPKEAVGLWQFMAPTAQQYKLRVDEWVDQRRDPLKATRAAAQHFRYLYDLFDDWELALAAYNAGEGRVQRAVQRAKQRNKPTDFWSLRLPRETRNYVPAIMASAIIYKNKSSFGLDGVEMLPPMEQSQFQVPVDFSLQEVAQRAGIPYERLIDYNPAYLREIPPIDQKHYTIYLPQKYQRPLWQSLRKHSEPSSMWLHHYTALLHDSAENLRILERYGDLKYVRVKRGENLTTVARKHNTTVSRLMRWNPIPQNKTLQIGQRLKMYVVNRKVLDQVQFATHPNTSHKGDQFVIRVPEGSTLSALANRYHTTVQELMTINRLRSPMDLRAGQSLKIYSRPKVITVPSGMTLSHVAQRYDVSVKELMAWNKLDSPTDLRANQSIVIAPPPQPQPHLLAEEKQVRIRVPSGATLSELAERYQVTVSQLMEWNQLKHTRDLQAGQQLTVFREAPPATPTHRVILVRLGDTLWDIAREHQTSIEQLTALNDLKKNTPLKLNQKIKVPLSQ